MVRAPLIAIADDDSAFANYLKTFLDARGYLARVYNHGEDLLSSARLGELPDVVLLDVMMPGMDGMATLRSLKAAYPDLSVIMLSGRDNAQTIVEALSLGAVNYVVKPDDPDDLGESELFGHEKGAFTGAATMRVGKFEHADGGTLMLDEIGEMKPALQGKLLHVLQDGEFSRLGSNKRVSADVRIVAATNRDLEAMLAKSEFREDLYYRLKVIEIQVPPLRERQDEIPQLIEFFTAKYAKRYNRREPVLAPALLA